MLSKISICVVVFLANYCFASDPCEMPEYIRVTFSNVTPVNWRCNDDCKITSADINGSYVLKYVVPDANYPWHRWRYSKFSPIDDPVQGDIVTTRVPGKIGPYDRCTGLRVCVTKDRYDPNTLWVEAVPSCCSEFGYAIYFSALKAPIDSGCVNNDGIGNEQNNCYCSPMYYIPPWSAGLGGSAVVEELTNNFIVYNAFAHDWFLYGQSMYDLDGDSDVDSEDLALFADEWLLM